MAHTLEEYATAIQQLDGLRDTFAAIDKEVKKLEDDHEEGFDLVALQETLVDITRSVNDLLRQFDMKIDFSNWPTESDAAKVLY